jgi:hypothetical protein
MEDGMKIRNIAAAIALCVASSGAVADSESGWFISGNDLLKHLNDKGWKDIAHGYILAVHDHPWARGGCTPSGVRPAQLIDVVERYLRQNIANRHNSASVLITLAFAEAWPCPKK